MTERDNRYMANPNDDYSDIVSRRQFVATAGASGAAALAGCTGRRWRRQWERE